MMQTLDRGRQETAAMSNDSNPPPNSEQVETLLRQRLGGQARGLGVSVEAGGVILRGHAPSFHVKQLAQHVVMVAMGLRIVANRIEVRPRPQFSQDPDS
jgi:osmotically-inducible protein OsmY